MLSTYARIENGVEVEQVVLRPDTGLPEGDWRPVVVEGLNFDRSSYRESGRETVIEPTRVVRRIVVEHAPPTQEDYSAAIQAHIEATAQSRSYGSSALLASYVTSTVPSWAAEAQAFVAWRDAVWLAAYGLLGAVNAGETVAPPVTGLIEVLPVVNWPPS
ncbi:MAG: hypothetical protein C0519_04045 [Hyphomicrobium sp.]|nr:hypothetical protein [Hyphomicrobium sp.]PPD07699.1 MAG: hypothetical protein CTY28_07565 [Hyphomicrobium sp.]